MPSGSLMVGDKLLWMHIIDQLFNKGPRALVVFVIDVPTIVTILVCFAPLKLHLQQDMRLRIRGSWSPGIFAKWMQ